MGTCGMWEDPGEKLQDGQMSATGQPKGHLGTLDFLKKVCIFPGILDAMAVSACGCLTWVLVNGQMETSCLGDRKASGETIQGCLTAFM